MVQQPKRTFASLRAQPSKSIAGDVDEKIEQTARRLFSGHDGLRVMGWLLERANAVTPLNSSNETLREAEGARRFMNGVLRSIAPE